MSTKAVEPVPEIPEVLIDPATGVRLQRGRFLGKGGFAKCYEITDATTGLVHAGKIVAKTMLVKPHQKDKMAQEISIHRGLSHRHIVGFRGFFEDTDFVYIVLELCKRRSLMELHKRRKAITEPEARYFMRQLLLGVQHLHRQRIIHRDLKLGNLFLNDDMELKIGDFGLATRLEYDGERKKTLCGTPNYIAPEVLCKKGHSFEVDVWSIGCILYTLLVGHPPFETQSLKDTYGKIKRNEYHIPSRIAPTARSLITRMLRPDPADRPTVDEVLADDFMTLGYLPPRLPLSCLTMAPRFDAARVHGSSAGVAATAAAAGAPAATTAAAPTGTTPAKTTQAPPRRPLGEVIRRDNVPDAAPVAKAEAPYAAMPAGPKPQQLLRDLQDQLAGLFAAKPAQRLPLLMDEAEDPAAVPMVWVSKWVDYSDKYGFGYQLSDDTIGVIFNDASKLLLLVDGKTIQYVERDGSEQYWTMEHYPAAKDMEKKMKLLAYFRSYMRDNLIKAGASIAARDGDELIRLPYLRQWFRTSRAVVMHLTNGTLQVNYFKDHVKLILCPLMGAVTIIDEEKNVRTFRLSSLAQYGCNADLVQRLQYVHDKIGFLLAPKAPALHSVRAK